MAEENLPPDLTAEVSSEPTLMDETKKEEEVAKMEEISPSSEPTTTDETKEEDKSKDPKGEDGAAASKESSSGVSESDTSDPLSISSDDEDEDVGGEDTPSDPTERIMRAVTHKEEGNSFFKSGDLSKAVRSYRKGTSALKSLNEGNTGDEQVKSLLVSLQTNLSMVCFKQNKPKMSRDVASKALDVDSTNVKALYRRAAAHRKLGNIDAARKDLRDALKHDPNNRDVKRELISIKKAQDEQKKKQKASLSKQKVGLQKAFAASQGSFLYNDKEEEEKKKKEAAQAKKKAEQEALKKRKADWEDECVKRMANDQLAITYEDWDKEQKDIETAEKKEREKARKEEEKRKKEERRKAREAAKAAKDDSSDDDDILTEKEASMLRGYKKTRDGRTTSYFSRELTDEQKAMIGDIAPQRLGDSSAPVPIPSPPADSAAAAGSAWNQAGTWEEKDTTEWCTARLKSHLQSTQFTSISHTANVKAVTGMTGDASVAVTGGKKRYIFDYHCEVEYDILDEDDCVVASGVLKLPDINSACLQEMEVEIQGWKKSPTEKVSEVEECRNTLVDEIRNSVYSFVSDFNAQY